MMSTKQWLMKTAGVGMFLTLVIFLCGNARSAGLVPVSWNVAPMTNGAYLESFTIKPDWANVGDSGITDVLPNPESPIYFGLPARSNVWFNLISGNTVLKIDTLGAVITNTLLHKVSNAVITNDNPVYIDMSVKFDAFVDPPESVLLGNAKIALYVNANTNLVVVHKGGATTNTTFGLETNQWHQITFKMHDNNLFDVLVNDGLVFTSLTNKSEVASNILSGVQFSGTGYLDNLYVSRGDPAYAVAGATLGIPALPEILTNAPTATQQTKLNKWLSGKTNVKDLGEMTYSKLSQAYLLDELPANGDIAVVLTNNFNISAIDVLSPTLVQVTAKLTINTYAKTNAINGKIVLLGKQAITNALWTVMGTNAPPTFSDGIAVQTFDIPDGYKFFKPQIIAPE